ncbi:MAG: glycoside hydrolase family 39, partial [Gemmatimonadetes bacterium]|nr:glycoside hydrolase family 39 [Gemmatimonadota bacterium]
MRRSSTLLLLMVPWLLDASLVEAQGATGGAAPTAFPVTIQVDASRTSGALRPIWRFFGADEPN